MWAAIGLVVGFIIEAVSTIAAAIWAALLAVWAVVGPIFGFVWAGLKAVWSDVLVPFWRLVEQVFQKLRDWWAKYLTPVTDFIKKVYQVERDLYKALFQPLLDTITRLKQFLDLTGLSHTALGRAIEDILGLLYNDINAAYQAIVQPVNSIIHTIEDFILTGGNLLRSDLLFRSIFANIGGIWSIWWNAGIKPLTADGRRLLQYFGEQHSIRSAHESAVTYLQTKSGPYAPHIEGAIETFKRATVLEEPDGLPPFAPDV